MIALAWLIPAFPLAAFLINGLFGRRWLGHLTGLIATVAIGLVYLPTFARVARGPVLAVVGREYIEAARAAGSGATRVLSLHVLPNVMAPLMVQTTLALSTAILMSARARRSSFFTKIFLNMMTPRTQVKK